MNSIAIQSKVHFRRGQRSKKGLCGGAEKPPASVGVVPRVSRLTALAIPFEELLRDGVVADQAGLGNQTVLAQQAPASESVQPETKATSEPDRMVEGELTDAPLEDDVMQGDDDGGGADAGEG